MGVIRIDSRLISQMDGATLKDGDILLNVDADSVDIYIADKDSGVAADGVKTVSPSINASDMRLIRKPRLVEEAIMGDMVMVITPTTDTPAPTAKAWEYEVEVAIKDASGNVHTWLTKDFATSVAITDDSAAGVASVDGETPTTLSLVNGKATITIKGTKAAWLNAETVTLTLSNLTIAGYTVTGGTCVLTFTTPG